MTNRCDVRGYHQNRGRDAPRHRRTIALAFLAGSMAHTLECPADVFAPVNYSTFSANDYAQLQGVKLSFRYPSDWDVVVGSHEGVLVYVGTTLEPVNVRCIFYLDDAGFELDPNEISTGLEEDGLRSLLPANASVSSSSHATVNGYPGATVEYNQLLQVDTTPTRMFMRMTIAYLQQHIFRVQCGTGGPEVEDLDPQILIFVRLSRIFDEILTSVKVSEPQPAND